MKTPDWDFWRHMSTLKTWQACALSFNIEPDSLRHSRHGWMAGPGGNVIIEPRSFPSNEIAERFDKRLRLLSAHITNPAFFRLHTIIAGSPSRCEIFLADFAKWAVMEMRFGELPPDLVALAQKPEKPTTPETATTFVDTPITADLANHSESSDWKEYARVIADELHQKDTKAGAYSSQADIAERVAIVMRDKKQFGPRGPLSGSTILREALQGGKWKRNQ